MSYIHIYIYIYIHISHRSISSQSSSIAGDETVLFILMVTALQQTDQEENRDGSHNMTQLIIHSYRDIKYVRGGGGGVEGKNPRKFILYKGLINQKSFISFTLTAEVPVITLSYLCKTTKAGMMLYKSGGEVIIRFVFEAQKDYFCSLITGTVTHVMYVRIHIETKKKQMTHTGRYVAGGGVCRAATITQVANIIDGV